MAHRTVHSFTRVGVVALWFVWASPAAFADLTFGAGVGHGPFGGATYANFDNLDLGATGGTSNGVGVSFIPDGQAVQGSYRVIMLRRTCPTATARRLVI